MNGLRSTGLLIVLLPLLGACSGGKAGSDNATPAASPSPEAGTTATATTNRLCSLYTASEIKDILGTAVADGHADGPMATACQWAGTNAADGAYAQVQVIPGTKYWEKHTGAKGYEVLKGIGKEANVAMALGGWEAGTVTDNNVVFVSLNGGTASRNSAVAFLKQTLAKLGPGT